MYTVTIKINYNYAYACIRVDLPDGTYTLTQEEKGQLVES
jgi:hypothetical protein